jgi:uncharacterized protein (DUF697 family)
MENNENVENEGIDKTIRRHVGFAMVAGAIPIPLVDIVAVTAIQLDLIKDLAKYYEVDYSKERGKVLATTLIGTTVGNLIGRAGASAIKAIPGIGTILGIGSMAIFAGASTYALGKVFENHFKEGGDLFDLDVEKWKERFKDFFKRGKTVAEDMRNNPNSEDIVATIEKLQGLKESGAITEKEYESTKKELLEKLKNL